MKIDFRTTSLICPNNDGEAATMIAIGKRLALDVRVSDQPWGATLDCEPPSTFQNLKATVVIVEIPGLQKERELSKSHQVIIIDHHTYFEVDRSNPKCSLEQFADLVDYTLTRWEMGIAINDRGYIPALERDNYSQDEIQQIREFDLKAQGYSDEDFRALEADYTCGSVVSNQLYVVATPRQRTSYLSDVHYWRCRRDGLKLDLLIFSVDSSGLTTKASFSGRPELAQRFHQKFGGFSGGDPASSMYWGMDYSLAISQDDALAQIKKAL